MSAGTQLRRAARDADVDLEFTQVERWLIESAAGARRNARDRARGASRR